MSDIIKLLPESIANQIAAGEVVQAPSYVVKELLENAIDAGATEIRVEVIDYGKTCIHVLDNGKGMSPTDARMAFERHATSKISTGDDLHRLTTMGFRGEALAAICAVSQVELQTRQASDELGTSLQLSGSQVVKTEPCVMSPGTSIKVKDLYFNTPARRRFLPANNRGYNDIVKEFDRVALVYPQVAMFLYKDGKLVKELPKSQLKQRILSAVTTTNKKSTQLEKDLLRIHYDSPIIRISGYVGQPEGATKTKSQQFFFVNHRYMDHPYFSKAVALAFENFIPDGAKPNFFIYFEVAPEDIDINVHPAKTEIRFANQEAIFPLLRNLVREAITSSKSYAQISFEEPTIDIPTYTGRKEEVHHPGAPKMIRRVLSSPGDPLARAHAGLNTARFRSLSSVSSDSIDWNTFATPPKPQETENPNLFGDIPSSTQNTTQSRRHLGTNTRNSLGIIHYNDRYIVSPLRGNLAIIDYHRAKYRLLYEQFLEEFDPKNLEIEQRLYNEYISFSEGERELVIQALNELRAIGFEYSPEAESGQIAILSSPKLMGDRVAELLQEILHKSMETHEPIMELARTSLAELYAKSKAIGRMPSSEEEIALFLGELFSCSDPNFTPDGRRIIFVISERDVDNYFA